MRGAEQVALLDLFQHPEAHQNGARVVDPESRLRDLFQTLQRRTSTGLLRDSDDALELDRPVVWICGDRFGEGRIGLVARARLQPSGPSVGIDPRDFATEVGAGLWSERYLRTGKDGLVAEDRSVDVTIGDRVRGADRKPKFDLRVLGWQPNPSRPIG